MKLFTPLFLILVINTLTLRAANAFPLELNFSPIILVNSGLFSVDITLNNLQSSGVGSLGAFDMEIFFNTSSSAHGHDVLALQNVTFSHYLGDPAHSAFTGWSVTNNATGSDVLSMFNVSLLPISDLLSLPDNFSLATLTFSKLSDGFDNLFFGMTDLSTADGQSIQTPIRGTARVVPEPDILLLIMLGIFALSGYRRKFK